MRRREFLAQALAGTSLPGVVPAHAQGPPPGVFLERAAPGTPHRGKALLAVQAHSDDIPLSAAGTAAKLVKEGSTGHLICATNDDLGDAPGLGTPGIIGEHVHGNERDNDEVARILGLKRVFNLNYGNHRMGDVSQNELQCRLIFLIRLLKADTVVCWDPWAHDEENPDHAMIARGVEAACWMAGRSHDYPEQFAAGLTPHAVQEKYYNARRPEITRVVDITDVTDQKVEANHANRAKGLRGSTDHGSGQSWPGRISACRYWATTTRPPTATTSRSSCWRGTAISAGNTASSMARRSITSDHPPRHGSRNTSRSMQFR
jgi:LmbE family N-acetylglucosaminyl deacetylase